jgi:hypothetical protein
LKLLTLALLAVCFIAACRFDATPQSTGSPEKDDAGKAPREARSQ